MTNLPFSHPLGDLGVTYGLHLYLAGIELFTLALTAEML